MATLWAIVVGVVLLASTLPADASSGRSNPATGGDELWRARYDGPASSTDSGEAIATSPDGSMVFVAGSSPGDASYDFLTIAYDRHTGEVVWIRRQDSGSDEEIRAIAVSPDGRTVYVTGTAYGWGLHSIVVTVAYAAITGAIRWLSTYGGPEATTSISLIAVSPDGSQVFVSGSGDQDEGFDSDVTTLAYDASTGERLWVEVYGSAHSDWATGLAVSPDGSKVFVSGYTQVSLFPTLRDYATIAYSAATGEMLWNRSFDGRSHGDDTTAGVAVSPDGSTVFVGGASDGTAEASQDFFTVAYDSSTGEVRWARRSDAGGWELVQDVTLSPDGRMLVVAGTTRPTASADGDYLTIAYDAISGTPRWARRYDGPATGEFLDDIINDIVIAPDGSRVFVTGNSDGMGPYHQTDYATIAYDVVTGAIKWVARYTAPSASFDLPFAIDVTPDSGAVVVTGKSGRGGANDIETIAYEA